MLRTSINSCIGLLQKCRYRDIHLNRVLAPEGELLSFASPKESSQRKGDPMPLASCAPAFFASARRGMTEFHDNCVTFVS